MHKRTLKTYFVISALACGLAWQPLGAWAQEGQGSVAINNSAGRVSVKLERGSKVAISNRYGRITITGWDRDSVEAVATSEKGAEAIQVELTADPQAHSVLTLAVVGRGQRRTVLMPGMDFQFEMMPGSSFGWGTGNGVGYGQGGGEQAPKAKPADKVKEKEKERTPSPESNVIVVPKVVVSPNVVVTPDGAVGVSRAQTAPQPARAPQPPRAQQPGEPRVAGSSGGSSSGINLDVKIPRYAELSAIEVRSGDLTVSNVDGPVNITSINSDIKVNHVGALEVHARSGSVTVEDVSGLAYVSASSGDITVRRASGDVRAVSINGDMNIECVRGRVDVSNARGAIKLAGISGDVDATTTSSNITYTGAISNNGRYRLKSVEGEVNMAVPDSSPGFTAFISSYNGAVQTDFTVKDGAQQSSTPVNHRVEARHGNGQAQITLDSFSQPVRLTRLTTVAATCQ